MRDRDNLIKILGSSLNNHKNTFKLINKIKQIFLYSTRVSLKSSCQKKKKNIFQQQNNQKKNKYRKREYNNSGLKRLINFNII